MKTNKAFWIVVLIMGLVLVGGLAAQNRGDGWPPASILPEYGLAGMKMSAAMTDVQWNVETDIALLHIRFSGPDATFTAIKIPAAERRGI